MSTLALTLDQELGTGGLSTDAQGRLSTGEALRTAVEISLFTRRADQDDDAETTRQSGWWADTFDDIPIGSRLWTLAREKMTTQTLALARAYAFEALQWLVDDGVAASIDVEVERYSNVAIACRIRIQRSDGTFWDAVWEEVRLSAL